MDLVAYAVAEGGYVTLYESQIADPMGAGVQTWDPARLKLRRIAHNRQRLRAEAGDYIGAVFSILREIGLPVVASIRMNDAHMSGDPTGPLAGQFWRKHPQWRLGAPYGYYASCLSYAVPEVRGYLRRLVQEIIAKFPAIAGIELDGMRSLFFFRPGEGAKNGAADDGVDPPNSQRPRCGGRCPGPPPLPVASLRAAHAGTGAGVRHGRGGVEPRRTGGWRFARLLQHRFRASSRSVAKLPGQRLPIHAYVNCSPAAAMYLSLEEYRAAAANAYGAGATAYIFSTFPASMKCPPCCRVPWISPPCRRWTFMRNAGIPISCKRGRLCTNWPMPGD